MKIHKGQPWILPRISNDEIQQRHRRLRKEMDERDICCLVVAGSQVNYGAGSDNIRYLSNYGIYYGEGYIVFPISGEARMFCRSMNQEFNAQVASDIPTKISGYPVFAEDVENYLRDLKLEKGNIGIVGAEIMPTAFFLDLQRRLSDANLYFVSDILLEMRLIKSPEELAFVEKAGEIADYAYNAILCNAKPGIKEFEVFAEVDKALYSHGAASTFILLTSGPTPSFPPCPGSHRTLELHDTIMNEISPCYGGLWIQWGRQVSIGDPDMRLFKLYKVAMEVYECILSYIRPGVTYEEVTKAAHEIIRSKGYSWLAPATQHIGLDITEMAYVIKGTPKNVERISRPMDKRPLKPGMVIVNQPNVVTKDLQMGAMIIDTLIVTQDGCKVVSKSPLDFVKV